MQTSLKKNRGLKSKIWPELTDIFHKTKVAIARAKMSGCDFAIIPYPDQTTLNYLIASGYRYDEYTNNRMIVRFM